MTTATRAIAGIRNDPVGFCGDVLRFEPWSKQAEILRSVRDHKRTAVRSAHGVGKTRTAAAAVLWFLAAFPRSRVVTTAPTWAQVREQLWREVSVLHRQSDGFIGGSLTETALELAPDWFALGLSTDTPERFQGYHAEHLLLVVDEASGVAESIFEASEGFLTSAGAKVLLIGNPTRPSGQFFRCFTSERDLWNTIAIPAFHCPAFTGEKVPPEVARRLVSVDWVEQARRRWGEGSPLWDVRVMGRFPQSSDDTVIPLAAVEDAQRRSVEPGSPVVIAVDVARFGSDETVVVVRRGDHLRIAATWSKLDTMETCGRVLRIARRVRDKVDFPAAIVIDDVGLGGGVVDRLREVAEYPTRVVDYNGGRSSPDRDYPNRRSFDWFAVADRIGGLDLPDDELLVADLVAPRYSIDSRGRRVVEPKEQTKRRLGRSPDRADALVMALHENGHHGSSSAASIGGSTELIGAEPGRWSRSGKLDPTTTYTMRS